MHTIIEYLELARARNHFRSDRQLAKALGFSSNSVSAFRLDKALPAPETMVKLAGLAGISKEQALLELSYWNAKDEETRTVYKSLMGRISGALTASIIAFMFLISLTSSCFASSGTDNHLKNINIHYHTIRTFFLWLKSCFLTAFPYTSRRHSHA